ncbi:MAG: hypothetical protein WCK32_08640 [Chlorobiaceae bacterium]
MDDNALKKKYLLFFMVPIGYTVLVALLFYQLVFQSKVPIAPDSLIPQALSITLQRLQDVTGIYPLWQPWLFSGMPTVEAFSFLSNLYYPNVLLSLLNKDPLFLQLLHFIFAGSGVFLLLRNYRLTTFASFFGGAVFMLNPYMTAMLVHGHGSQLMTAAYMPWMLWATMRLIERGGLLETGLLALITGFQMQRAHVQIAYYTWLLVLLLALFLLYSRRDSFQFTMRRSMLLLVALVLGAGISTAIYLPSFQYASYSIRGVTEQGAGSSWEYATLWSMHPMELLTFLLPGSFGFGGVTYWGFMPFTDFPHYAGIIVLLFSIGGAVVCRKEPMVKFLVVALLFSLLLSFGRFFTPVFDLFYHFAPFFSRFRVPSMALIMVYLILALLSAVGVHQLFLHPRARLLNALKAALLALAVILALFLVFEQNFESFCRAIFPSSSVENFDLAFMVDKVRWEYLKESFLTLVFISGLSAGVIWLIVKQKLSWYFSAALLFFLAIGDLLWCDLQIAYPSAASLRFPVLAERQLVNRAFQHDEITRYLESQQKPFRVYPAGPIFAESKFALFGIESVGGYHPAKLKLYEEFLAKTGNLASLNILRMLNVAYVISPLPLGHPELVLVKTGLMQLVSGPETVNIYRLQRTVPRAWFAERVTAVKNDEELFNRLLTDELPPGQAFVDASLWTGSRTFSPATVTSLDIKPEIMRIKVVAPRDAFLVVSEIFYPLRWKVKVDGRETSIVKVNGLLRGVIIPAGSREVCFYYDRSVFETGQKVSLFAFVATLLLVAGGIVTDRFKQRL